MLSDLQLGWAETKNVQNWFQCDSQNNYILEKGCFQKCKLALETVKMRETWPPNIKIFV